MPTKQIYYSDKYFDDHYEYRHVMLPKDLAKLVPKNHLVNDYLIDFVRSMAVSPTC